jgi:hypothetical protein
MAGAASRIGSEMPITFPSNETSTAAFPSDLRLVSVSLTVTDTFSAKNASRFAR